MNQESTLGFIGGGRITRLLLRALKQKNSLPEKVLVADPNEDMKKQVQAIDTAVIECVSNNVDVLNVDMLFLAVHPPVVKDVALIPIISMEKMAMMLGGVKKLVRMIPNAPSIIQKGYNPVVFSDEISTDEKQQLQQFFSYWGEAPEVDEQRFEAYAIVTAMGPTYFWFQWLKLQELGKQFGMSDAELKKALPAMLHGAAETLFESDLSSKDVLDLIPVCPLKDDEPAIQGIFERKLTGLYAKLTQK